MQILQLFQDTENFVSTEWADFKALLAKMPPEIQTIVHEIEQELGTAASNAEWVAGDAVSTYIANNSSNITAEVQTLVQASGAFSAVGPSYASAMQAVIKTLVPIVLNAVAMMAQNVKAAGTAPAPLSPAPSQQMTGTSLSS